MEKTTKQIKTFAIFYVFVAVLNILALILNGGLRYLFMTLLSFAFGLTLYNASKDITKYRLPLYIATLVLVISSIEAANTLFSGGLFMAATNIFEVILVFYVISLLNILRKEVTTTKEEKKEN